MKNARHAAGFISNCEDKLEAHFKVEGANFMIKLQGRVMEIDVVRSPSTIVIHRRGSSQEDERKKVGVKCEQFHREARVWK